MRTARFTSIVYDASQPVEKRLAPQHLEEERREAKRILRERDELEIQVAELMRELFGE